MGRRTAAFVASALAGMIELFGALYGQGVQGHGLLFGLGGDGTRGEAVALGLTFATVTILAGVGMMMVRETRWSIIALVIASVAGTAAAGQVFGYGAALALVGAVIASRIDRSAALV